MSSRAVKSALRTLEVLELMKKHRRPLKLKEIYEELDYPQSSATYLLKSLAQAGYINYNRKNRTYLPSVRVSELGSWLNGYIYSDMTFHTLIDALQKRSDETVGLSIQNDLLIQYIIMKEPEHEFKFAPSIGTMRPMVESAAGLALLSKMDNTAVENIIRYSSYYNVTKQRLHLPEIMDQVKKTRELGYAYVKGKPTEDLAAICVPINASLHGLPVSVGTGGFVDRIEAKLPFLIKDLRAVDRIIAGNLDVRKESSWL